MELDIRAVADSIAPQTCTPEELQMVNQEAWSEIRRLRTSERLSVSELARRFELDRRTVRRCLEADGWRTYKQRGAVATILTPHREFLERRAPEVSYSARILYQELQAEHGYTGSYETVKRFVAPLRTERSAADLTQTRFETPPGLQSQID